MKSIRQLSDQLDITPQRLQYWLDMPDAPEPTYRMQKKRMVRFYNEDQVLRMWDER